MKTDYIGIDYSLGKSNFDTKNGIHFGVIPHNEVGQAWYNSSEPFYIVYCPYCGYELKKGFDSKQCYRCKRKFENGDFDEIEPSSFIYKKEGYLLEQNYDDPDIWVFKSPYYSKSQYCSPCAPGAGYLMNEIDDGIKTYCLGPDFFENGKAPYKVYSVKTNKEIRKEYY